jgi:fibronectin-binding autotransporter adhesin
MFSTSRAAIPASRRRLAHLRAGMTATISAVMEGSGGIDKTDLGTLVLSVPNTYTGGATFTAGVLSIDRDANLGAGTGALTFNGGTLRTTSGVTSARTVTPAAGGGTIDNGGQTDLFSGAFSGSGTVTKLDAGTLTLTLTLENTYMG